MECFSNLKVVELASVLAGPAVGMFFAELGAEVIKIENARSGGDLTRKWKHPNEDPKSLTSAYFSSVNYGKKHLLLDFQNQDQHRQMTELVKDVDILLVNFKHGDAKKFGVDYEAMQKLNPALIYGEISGFSSMPERTAFDVVLQAEAGFMFMNGNPDYPPTKMPVALIDLLAAHQLKEGILTAIIQRQNSGKGCKVTASLEKSAIASLANQASNWLMNNVIPQRIGSLHPNIAPYGETLICRNNKAVVLAIGTNAQFEKLCEVLEVKELASRPEYISNQDRVNSRSALLTELQSAASNWTRDELTSALIANNVPAGAIRNMEEVFQSPAAKSMILREFVDGKETRRVSTIAFEINETSAIE